MSSKLLTEWWPIVARYAGLILGAYGIFVAQTADKAVVLSFAGALIVSPNIADAQSKRNRQRALGDD